MTKYALVESYSSGKLAKAVNLWLAGGWRLWGSPQVELVERSEAGEDTFYYAQALVKEDAPPKPEQTGLLAGYESGAEK